MSDALGEVWGQCRIYRVPGRITIYRIITVVLLALSLSGCAWLQQLAEQIPTPQPTATATAEPTPTITATSTPTATVTATRTKTATPRPTATATPTWVVTLLRYQGFGGCSPLPEPSTRTRCDGDRTPYFAMPDYSIVPKGAGCEVFGDRAQHCQDWDTPTSPCGGAPACDRDHMACERVRVGCGGQERGDPRGSALIVTGDVQCAQKADHYGLWCTGAPGTTYEICSEPYTGHGDDYGPIPVRGSGRYCRSGHF